MTSVDLKILAVGAVTIATYTLVANVIPQLESELPPEMDLSAEMTPDELVAIGSQLYEGAGGCVVCHSETPGGRAPNLRTDFQGEGTIGSRCADRVEGLSCKEYLHQSLVRPGDHMVEGYPPIMPSVERTLAQPQIWAIVAYLESQGGEVTVTTADIPDEPADAPPPGEVPGAAVALSDPAEIVRQECSQCHVHQGEGVQLGPALDGIGARRSVDELRRAILDPPSVVSEGNEELVGLMPADFGRRFTAEQLESVVQYLSGLR
ncbi:MAG: c-type cytochrome [Gemmatimonadota bacterium]